MDKKAVRYLYDAIVAQARQQELYTHCNVPDTLDGRFEMIVLHLHDVLVRLSNCREAEEEFNRQLVEIFFEDMDISLREMGIGDISVPKKIKKMVQATYGRFNAYTDAGKPDGTGLQEIMCRNIFSDHDVIQEPARHLAKYAGNVQKHLRDLDDKLILAGNLRYPGMSILCGEVK